MKYAPEDIAPQKLYILLGKRIRQLRKKCCMTQEDLMQVTRKYLDNR